VGPKFAQQETVIDNSSAWRMDPTKIIVPEINASELTAADKIIANPNCSTIQMVLLVCIENTTSNVIVSTYQSITGTGVKAVQQSNQGVAKWPINLFTATRFHNAILSRTTDKEEIKLVREPKKILGDNTIAGHRG
jgi:aspartate-semialdehyde dehydrogenase